MESTDKIIKRGKFKGYKVIHFDIMLNGMFVFQLAYRHCPIFKLDIDDVRQEIYKRRPSLQNKRIEICQTDMVI